MGNPFVYAKNSGNWNKGAPTPAFEMLICGSVARNLTMCQRLHIVLLDSIHRSICNCE